MIHGTTFACDVDDDGDAGGFYIVGLITSEWILLPLDTLHDEYTMHKNMYSAYTTTAVIHVCVPAFLKWPQSHVAHVCKINLSTDGKHQQNAYISLISVYIQIYI